MSGGPVSSPALLAGWYALCQERQVRKKPVRKLLGGRAVVLWRHPDGISASWDICPHRGAPLSQGSVDNGLLVCPYHGWGFGPDGACMHMPALDRPFSAVSAATLPLRVVDGLVFVGIGEESERAEPAPALIEGSGAAVFVEGEVETTLADFAENILDTTHTSVVHKGYLRTGSAQSTVRPEIETGRDWIQARYAPEATPRGILGLLAGGRRYTITDRFRAPGTAEVTYARAMTPEFAVQFYLRPTTASTVAAIARIQVPGDPVLARAKALAARIALQKVFAQDRKILHAVARNQRLFDASGRRIIAPQDVLRGGIEAILAGRRPRVPDTVPEIRI